MGIAIDLLPVEIILAVILRTSPDAHIGKVSILVKFRDQRKVCLAGGRQICRLLKPAMPHTFKESVREHRGAGGLAP